VVNSQEPRRIAPRKDFAGFPATVTIANSYDFKAQRNEVVVMLKSEFAPL